MSIWKKLANINRHWIYFLIATSILLPLIFPMKFPIGTSSETQSAYDAVEALPDSCVVMVTFDVYPNALAETEPMAVAALHHFFRKHCKVITETTIPFGGPSIAERVTRKIAAEYGKEYGVDFVNLGYKPNYTAVLAGMGNSIKMIYPTDNSGTPLDELPLMEQVKNYDDIKFIFIVADNGIVDDWVKIVNAQYHVPMCAGVAAVMAPKLYSFVGSGQLKGLLAGMKGAAEYEQLVHKPWIAVKGMSMQSLVHLLIIGLVLVGNVDYILTRRKQKKENR